MLYLNKQYRHLYLVYYQQHSEYQLTMNKHQFHDSGIVDEGLSDETGSIEDQENHSGKKKKQNFVLFYILENNLYNR
jgi:hypothetical protein